MTEDLAVRALAAQAGLEVEWTDAKGERRTVELDTLRAVLNVLELPGNNSFEISESAARLHHESQSIPPLQVVRPGGDIRLAAGRHAELISADGTRTPLQLHTGQAGNTIVHAPREAGYYHIECEHGPVGFAVAPPHALRPQDIAQDKKFAGLAVQIYSLRGGTSWGFGDFSALISLAREAGRAGIDALMVSPTHALVGADPGNFNPYSPSTRQFLNPLFADATLEGLPAEEDSRGDDVIDWRRAGPAKYQRLRGAFERFQKRPDHSAFTKFCSEGGERLRAHAMFETLDARFRKDGIVGFPNWPSQYSNPQSAGAFLRDAPDDMEFQLFLQWLSARSAAAAQRAARESMAIGLITDIAVGVDPLGSHAWSAAEELLRGLHIGAPPDFFNTHGQDWGLTSFSPRTLLASGYNSFLAMLRANMAYAGGVRIDHVLGFRRLWVIPPGASPADGVYLKYPQRELLGLTALESQLKRVVVVGEDLGTVPDGFRHALSNDGVLGMQVLWFERDHAGDFTGPGHWRRDAVAMTTTHDLPTVAGWWSGHDIGWQSRLGHLWAPEEQERTERAADRERLWSALCGAGCASGAAPPPEEPEIVITSVLQFIGKSRCSLAIVPVEDLAGEREQPNFPGTTNEHPNWRRRMKQPDLLDDAAARTRVEALLSARSAT